MVTIIRLLGFILSTAGYWEMLRKNSEISVFFIPSLTVAIQVNTLFLCGILNLLPEGAWILCFLGIMGFFYLIRTKGEIPIDTRSYFNVGFLFFGITMICMALFLKRQLFVEYDNFSHWALVVKRMLEVNRYPTFQDLLIEYQAYPLGSSTFLYFFAKIVGNTSEPVLMLAQLYMMLTCILPLFSLAEKNRFCGMFVIAIATNFFFTYNIVTTSLLVDTLLPLAGMCGVMFTVMYCREQSNWRNVLFATSYAILLVQIKNSGVLFAGIICLQILIRIPQSRFVLRFSCTIATIFTIVLWHKHCGYVFQRANQTTHALSFSYAKQTFLQKSAEDVRTIVIKMIEFSMKWKDFWAVLLVFIVLGIIILLFVKIEFRLYKKVLSAVFFLYAVYQVGMLGMYLASMPGNEALTLAGNIRYAKTIIIAAMYLYIAMAVRAISCLDPKLLFPPVITAIAVSTAFCSLLFLSTGRVRFVLTYTPTYSYNSGQREWLESAIEEYHIPDRKNYCILIPKSDSGYTYYLGAYLLQSNSITTIIADDASKLENIDKEYIFVYDENNEVIKDWISQNYPEQIGAKVIRKGMDS